MADAPYALALAAGLLAAVNPCGFALLPAYLSLLVAGEPGEAAGRAAALRRALLLTAAMTLGFVAVFGLFGLLAAPAADALARRLPWLSILIGVSLVGLGAWLLAGRRLPSFAPGFARGPAVTGGFASMVGFGAAYAVASLGCTVGPFLAVVVAAGFRGGSPLAGAGLFLAYAAGMAAVVGLVAVSVAVTRMSLVHRLRRATPVLTRASGGLVALAGGYVAWYGAYELRVFAGGDTSDPIVEAAGRVQSTLAGWLDTLGVTAVAGLAAALLGAGGLLVLRRARRRSRQPSRADESAPIAPS